MKSEWQELPQDSIFKDIGDNLKKIRLSYEYSQSDLATKTDLSRSTIQRMERGEALNFDSIIRIFRVYGRLNDLQRVFKNTENINPFKILRNLTND